MAELGSKIELLQKNETNIFVGVNPDKREECILITYDNSIIVYDNFLKKIAMTWLLGKGQHFTCPVIYNKQDDEYVAVVDSKIIKTFLITDTTMSESGENFTVNQPILQLYPDSENSESFVMFKNGAIVSLSKVFVSPRTIPECDLISTKLSLLTSQVQRAQDSVYLCMIMFEKEEFSLIFTSFHFSMEVETPNYVKIPLQGSTRTIASACLCSSSNSSLAVVLLWNNGEINKSCLTLSQPLKETNYSTQLQKVASIDHKKSKNRKSIVMISEDTLAVLSNDSLVVIDLKFGVTHSVLPQLSHVAELYAARNLILFSERGSLSGCVVTPKPVNLASVLKKQAPTSSNILEHLKWSTTNSTVAPGYEKNIQNTEILLKSDKETELKEAWAALTKSLTPFFIKKICSSSFIRGVMDRLTSEKGPWFPQLLEDIISSNKISTSVCPLLITRIIQKENRRLLLVCLTNLLDITESDIAMSLDFTLGKMDVEMDTENENFSDQLMSQLLTLPYTDNQMIAALRKLSLEKTMSFLAFLTEKLKIFDLNSQTKLTFDKIVAWPCLVLDAQFTQIIVSSDSWKALGNLQEMVEVKVELFEELREIEVILTKLKNAFEIKRRPKHFSYRVEKMRI